MFSDERGGYSPVRVVLVARVDRYLFYSNISRSSSTVYVAWTPLVGIPRDADVLLALLFVRFSAMSC